MDLKAQFPILNTSTYLNTASSGLLSSAVMDWRRNHDQEFHEKGGGFRLRQAEFLQEVKSALTRFFHAGNSEVFLLPNFSHGFNAFLCGLSSRQRFLLLEEDYPSVNYAVQSRGFNCAYVRPSEHMEADIEEQIRLFKPTVFAFSLVQYISGIKISLEFLRHIKNTFPDLLIVADGTQFCGTADFDFEASGLDILLASGYKWMMGGYGNGFAFVKAQAAAKLYTGAGHMPAPKEAFLQDKSLLSFYFEPGHQDTLVFGSLWQSVLFLERLSMPAVARQIAALNHKAKAAFSSRGLLEPAAAMRKEISTIFNLNLSPAVFTQLEAAGIRCINRGKGIRVAFHFYNTEQDLNHLLEVIDQSRGQFTIDYFESL